MIEKVRHVLRLDKIPPAPRKIIVGIIGGFVFACGVVMIFTPGPAFVLIPVGLLLLGSEFKFAERWSEKALHALRSGRRKWRAWRQRRRQTA